MTTFLLASASLLLIAAVIVTWPLWRRQAGTAAPPDVDAMRRQLQQLQDLHGAGALSDEHFAASKAGMERRLIDALVPPAEAAAGEPSRFRSGMRLPLALAVFMLAVTGGGYWLVGSPRNLDVSPGGLAPGMQAAQAASDPSAQAPHELTRAQIEDMATRLAARLEARPDDAEGWMMLARSWVAVGEHEKAIRAFARAERLRPRDADLLADYADARAMTQGKSLEGEPSALLRRALEVDPRHPKALALAGTAAFDRKDYEEAVRNWQTLARTEPPDRPFAEQVRAGIAEARRLGGLPPASADAPTAAAASSAKPSAGTVAGTVTLAAALAERASPDDVLFVFARAASGARMPLAIVRKRVKDLPLEFVLDDSMAMSPEANLSSVRQVVVGARVSHSGNAAPQEGDLEGLTPPTAVGTTGLHLEINQAVAR